MGVKGLNENNINCKMLSDQLRGRVRLFTLWVSKLAAKKNSERKKRVESPPLIVLLFRFVFPSPLQFERWDSYEIWCNNPQQNRLEPQGKQGCADKLRNLI